MFSLTTLLAQERQAQITRAAESRQRPDAPRFPDAPSQRSLVLSSLVLRPDADAEPGR